MHIHLQVWPMTCLHCVYAHTPIGLERIMHYIPKDYIPLYDRPIYNPAYPPQWKEAMHPRSDKYHTRLNLINIYIYI